MEWRRLQLVRSTRNHTANMIRVWGLLALFVVAQAATKGGEQSQVDSEVLEGLQPISFQPAATQIKTVSGGSANTPLGTKTSASSSSGIKSIGNTAGESTGFTQRRREPTARPVAAQPIVSRRITRPQVVAKPQIQQAPRRQIQQVTRSQIQQVARPQIQQVPVATRPQVQQIPVFTRPQPVQVVQRPQVQQVQVVDYPQFQQAPVAAVTYDLTGNALGSGGITLDSGITGGAKEVIVYEDGSIVEVGGAGVSSPVLLDQGFVTPNLVERPRPVVRPQPVPVVPRAPVALRNQVVSSTASSGNQNNIRFSLGSPESGSVRYGSQGATFSSGVPASGNREDIIAYNRQLIQRQNAGGALPSFGGGYISNNFLGTTLYSGQYGGRTTSQRTSSITGSRQSDRSSGIQYNLGNTASGIGSSAGSNVRQSTGLTGLNADIRSLNRDLLQKQNEAGLSQTFGGVVNIQEGNLDAIDVTSGAVDDLRQRVRSSTNRISGSAANQGSNIRSNIRNTVTSYGSRGSVNYFGPASRPQIVAPVRPQPVVNLNEDIVALNRDLIRKQNEAGISETFGGVVDVNRGNLQGVAVTSNAIGDLRRRVQSSGTYYAPARPQSATGTSSASGAQGPNIRFNLGNAAGIDQSRFTQTSYRRPATFGSRVTTTRYGYTSGIAPTFNQPQSAPINVQRNTQSSVTGSQVFQRRPVLAANDDIISLNRGLIKKQNEAELSEVFGGIANAEGGSFDGAVVSSYGIEELRNKVGYGSPADTQRSPIDAAGPVLSADEDIIALNRDLIQRQNQAGTSDVFGGVVDLEKSNLEDVTVSSDVIKDLKENVNRQTVRSQPQSPVVPKPVSAAREDKYQYTGIRTTAIRQPARVSASQFSQGGSVVYAQDNAATYGAGVDNIVELNRMLIQSQNQGSADGVFGGLINVDGSLAGAALSNSEIDQLRRNLHYQVDQSGRAQGEGTANERRSRPQKPQVGGGNTRFTQVQDVPASVVNQESIPVEDSKNVPSSVQNPVIQEQQQFEEIF